MGTIIEDRSLRNGVSVFKDRSDAGAKLARFLKDYKTAHSILFAIPSGGVPVGLEVAKALGLPLDLVVVRKVQVPGNPEAGLGAVNLDGDVSLNQPLIDTLQVPPNEKETEIERAVQSVRERNALFRQDRDFPSLKGRTVILLDDGLASGYTMLAAINYVHKRNPGEVIIAVPTGSLRAVEKLASVADRVCCLNIRSGPIFAVAEAYRRWVDLSDGDVQGMI